MRRRIFIVGLGLRTQWAKVQAVLRRGASARQGEPAPRPSAPASAEWDEAFLRVESYLRAHHFESRVLLNRLTAEIIEAARAVAVLQPGVAPVTVAMQVVHARIGEWMVESLGEGEWMDDRFRARGRLALLMADVPRKCPEHFLANAELPAEVSGAMRAAQLEPGPELRLTSMPPAPLEFGDAAQRSWVTFSPQTFVRAAVSWVALGGAMGVLWLITR